MIKRILFVGLIVFSSINICSGQKKPAGVSPILFRGVVIDASSQVRIANTEIMINRSRSIISEEDGTFSFYAYKNDTVKFSILGYRPASLIVNDTMSAKEFLTGVYLETDTLLIGEVIIIPKYSNLKAEMMNPKIVSDPELENARNNLNNASYAARTSPAKLGDPATNYDFLRTKMKYNAFEKGTIPSDKILGLSPLLLFPAMYLLIHGLPETPPPPKAQISSKDLNELRKIYQESSKNRK